jgi:GNAT superfamily N-acetyltransferase
MTASGEVDLSIEVRPADHGDVDLAERAATLIEEASHEYDIALRDVAWLRDKIETGHAAMAFRDGELVGFGFWSAWEGGRFISHSGLVVCPTVRGKRVGRRLKMVLFDESRTRYPDAVIMSLTTSEEVKTLNRSLGFKPAPLERLTTDESFWEGCKACRNWEDVRRRGLKCCCEAMILEPEDVP